jgi:hypothetical protein
MPIHPAVLEFIDKSTHGGVKGQGTYDTVRDSAAAVDPRTWRAKYSDEAELRAVEEVCWRELIDLGYSLETTRTQGAVFERAAQYLEEKEVMGNHML